MIVPATKRRIFCKEGYSAMAGCLFSIIPRSRTPFNLWKIYRNLSFIQVPISRNISPTTSIGSARPVFPPTYISSSTNIHFWETIKRRGIQTQTDPTNNNAGEEAAASHEFSSDDSKSVSNSVEVLESSASDNSVEYKALSNLKTSKRHDLAMVFTCKVCETRSVKTVCRESYEKGVVVVRCGGCSNLHLIADRLGWFGEPGSVEDLLAARGEEVRKGSIDSLNLTAEDLAGLRSS